MHVGRGREGEGWDARGGNLMVGMELLTYGDDALEVAVQRV